MAKQWQILEHTADVGITASGSTLGELFEALSEASAALICNPAQVRPREHRRLSVAAEDVEALAVDYVGRLLSLIQDERFMVARCSVRLIDAFSVSAELHGEPYDPARHELLTEIKAVTYHQLRIAREGDGWAGRLIFDL